MGELDVHSAWDHSPWISSNSSGSPQNSTSLLLALDNDGLLSLCLRARCSGAASTTADFRSGVSKCVLRTGRREQVWTRLMIVWRAAKCRDTGAVSTRSQARRRSSCFRIVKWEAQSLYPKSQYAFHIMPLQNGEYYRTWCVARHWYLRPNRSRFGKLRTRRKT